MDKRPLFNSVGAVVLLLLALIPVLLMSLTGRERKTDFDRAFAEACGGTYECSEIADVQKAKAGGASVQAAYTAAKDGQIQVYVTELQVHAGADGTFSVLVGIDRFSLTVTGISVLSDSVSDTDGALLLLADGSYLARFRGGRRTDAGQVSDRTGAEAASRELRHAVSLAFDLAEALKESEEHI